MLKVGSVPSRSFITFCFSTGFNCNDDNPKPICLPENYSKFELPNTGGGSDFDVDIDIDVDVDAQKTHVGEKHHS